MQAGIILNQRYQILELIAEGGMARVFRAHDHVLDRTVALKILREQYAADGAFLSRFQQEARAAAGLSHPNIVNVYDVGSEAGVNFIVMELIEGANLKQIIQQEGALVPARAIDLAQQILAALSFAHQRGIVHRDVKPQNILVDGQGRARVADFGIARAGSAPQLTETGIVMGSVHYCAPEQAMGKGSSAASDVYSVGVVLFEMLAGQVPFESDNALGVALKHVQEPPPSLRQVNPRLSPALENIANKALAKDPAARYATAEEMLQTIQSYRRLGEQSTAPFAVVSPHMVAGTATPAARRATGDKKAKSVKRHAVDWLVVVLGILILAMIAGWLPLGTRLYELYFQRTPAPSAAPSSTLEPVPGPIAVAPGSTATSPGAPTASASPASSPTTDPVAQMPLLVGRTFTDAERQVGPLGLRLQMVEDYTDARPVGYVTSQTVPPGSLVSPGETISVTVSVGSWHVAVPDVVNQPFEQAMAALQRAGLRIDYSRQYNERITSGRVVSQVPAAQSNVVTGTVISLVVSNGPVPVSTRPQPTSTPTAPLAVRGIVPNLIRLREAQARQLIEETGFNNTYTNYQDADEIDPANRDYFLSIPVGSVVSQNPPAGIRLDRGVIQIAVRRN